MSFISRSVRLAVVDSVPEDYVDLLAAAGNPGLSIHFLFSAGEALNLARRCQIALWVVNSRLCDMSGFELAEKLRSQRPNATVFIISDEYQLADELQTMTLGLTKYLCKPLEPSWVLPMADESCIPLSAPRDAAPKQGSRSQAGQPFDDRIVAGTIDNRASLHPRDRVILPFENGSTRRPAA